VGSYVGFRCRYCGYEQPDIPLGRGRDAQQSLELFTCKRCRTVGSTWVRQGETPLCGHCYDEAIELPDPASGRITCPRCGEVGKLVPGQGEWR